MKKLLLLLFIIKAVTSAPPNLTRVDYPKDNVQVLRYENDDLGKGSYRFAFEQSDGTKHEQEGEVKNEGQEDEYIVMRGIYSWVGPDGVSYTISYTADDNGFIPSIQQGQGGSIPEDILRLTG